MLGIQAEERGPPFSFIFPPDSCHLSIRRLLPPSSPACHVKPMSNSCGLMCLLDGKHTARIPLLFKHTDMPVAPCPNLAIVLQPFYCQQEMFNEFRPFFLEANMLLLQFLVTTVKGCQRPKTGIPQGGET